VEWKKKRGNSLLIRKNIQPIIIIRKEDEVTSVNNAVSDTDGMH